MTLKQKIESNPVLWFLGALLAAFLAGIGTFKGILEIAQLEVIRRTDNPEKLKSELSSLQKQVASLNKTNNELGTEIDRLRRVAANCRDLANPRTKCTIYVSRLPRADELVAELKAAGYNASTYGQDKRPPEEWQGIWIGDDVPADLALEAIKIGRRFLPNLRYVSLYGDNPGGLYPWPEAERAAQRSQIFLGATNKGAEALRPLSETDFNLLFDHSQSLETFHQAVRSFYLRKKQ